MMTKEDLIEEINENYKEIEAILQVVPQGYANHLRPTLETCVKLFWLLKYDKEFIWINDKKQEEFNLNEAIKDTRFSKFFSPLIISDMHSIRLLGNDRTHAESKRLNAGELNELFERLKRIIKEMEKVLGCPIIKSSTINEPNLQPLNETSSNQSNETNALLNKTVKHWVYGKGKIIKIVGDRMIVQFAQKQEEYGMESLKNGFLKVVDINKTAVEAKTRTYAPNIQEVKKAVGLIDVVESDEENVKSISKFNAIRLFKNGGLNILSKNCTFASKNSMSYLYWANPKIDLLENDWWLILNDNINGKLHLFMIPRNSLQVEMIKVRSDKPHLIDLQILFNDDRFTDTRSNIQFSKWHVKTLTY